VSPEGETRRPQDRPRAPYPVVWLAGFRRVSESGADQWVPPRTPVERVLAEIWAEVLDVERVGAHDSFLQLGGHSLSATQATARVWDQFRVQLTLRQFLDARTLAGLAAVISHEMAVMVGPEELAGLLDALDATT
jgi:hypothetical protein